MGTWRRKPDGRPYVDLQVGGKRRRVSLLLRDDTDNLTDAECEYRCREIIKHGLLEQDRQGNIAQNPSLLDLADWYTGVVQVARGSKAKTRSNARGALLDFASWCHARGVYRATDLAKRSHLADAYVRELLERYTARTACRHIVTISGLFNAAWERGIIAEIPVRRWPKPKKPRLHYAVLTPEELDRLLRSASGTEYGNFITFLAFTGLRFSDASELKWRNVHGDHIELVTQKTDTPLSISLAQPARDAIAREKDKTIVRLDGTVFLNQFGRRISFSAFKRVISKMGTRVLGRPITSKVFRQTVVTTLIRSGLDRSVVRQITGHSSVAIEAYIHLTGGDTAGIVERLMSNVTPQCHPQGTHNE